MPYKQMTEKTLVMKTTSDVWQSCALCKLYGLCSLFDFELFVIQSNIIKLTTVESLIKIHIM